jgi:hypothetical protein
VDSQWLAGRQAIIIIVVTAVAIVEAVVKLVVY